MSPRLPRWSRFSRRRPASPGTPVTSAEGQPREPFTTTLALLALTFATGLVDAVSYLGLGQVFTGFQTGNVVLLGFAFAGTDGFSIEAPAVSLVAFLVGSMLGGQLVLQLGNRFRHWFSLALLAESALLAAAAAATEVGPGFPVERRFLVIAALAVAMGLRNATVRRLAVPDITTTVLTSTITGLGTDSWLVATARRRLARRVSAISAMLLGAVSGALLVRESLLLPFLLVAGVTALISTAFAAPALLGAARALKRRAVSIGRRGR